MWYRGDMFAYRNKFGYVTIGKIDTVQLDPKYWDVIFLFPRIYGVKKSILNYELEEDRIRKVTGKEFEFYEMFREGV